MIELYKGGNCMPKVNMVELLKKAKEEKYAVPLINIDTLEWLHAVMDTAQRLQSPIIIGTAPFQVERLGGVHTVVGMIDGLVKDKGYTIPYVIHLDHGSSFEWCKKAIDAGACKYLNFIGIVYKTHIHFDICQNQGQNYTP